MRSKLALFLLLGIVLVLLSTLLYQSVILRDSHKVIHRYARLNSEYISYIYHVCNQSSRDSESEVFREMSKYLTSDSSLVVFLPNSLCQSCIASLVACLKTYSWPIHEIVIMSPSNDLTLSRKFILNGYQFIGSSLRGEGINRLLLMKRRENQIYMLQYDAEFENVLCNFLAF